MFTPASARSRLAHATAFAACGLAFIAGARADNVVQYLESARLAPGTVDLLDPVVGSSPGTTGHPVRIAAGDIVVLRFAIAAIPDSAVRGIQSYLTVYVPANAELVGARFIDAEGRTVAPRRAGLALDGCGGGSTCNTSLSQSGSIAQLYADTGVFYSDQPRSAAPVPTGAPLTLDAGLPLEPAPAEASLIAAMLGDTTPPWYAHVQWDRDHARAFDSDGNTTHGYGSPVAGPQTHYLFEVDADLGFRGTIGPWQRIRHVGSQVGTGVGGIGQTPNMTRVGVDTTAGHVLAPANPLGARAVRFAAGESRAGEVRHAEVALRVTGVPLDPAAGTDVVCAEVFGSDISSRSSNNGGMHHPWRFLIPHPACVDFRMPLTLDAEASLGTAGQPLSYRIAGRNLASAESNARIVMAFDSARVAFLSASPPPTAFVQCPPANAGFECPSWSLGDFARGEAFSIDVELVPGGSGATHTVVHAYYRSDTVTEYEVSGRSARVVTVLRPTSMPTIVLDNALDATTNSATPGTDTWTLAGSVSNAGSASWTSEFYAITLPASNWGLFGNRIVVGGQNVTCTSAGIQRTCTRSETFAPLQSRSLGLRVVVPGGTAPGLYPMHVAVRGTESIVGPFETEFHNVVTVPVGSTRTAAPSIDCPVRTHDPVVTGTAEPGATVTLRVADLPNGTVGADAGGVFAISGFASTYGPLFDGAELRATAQVAGELESLPSEPCVVLTINRAPTFDPIADPPPLAGDGRVRTIELTGIGSGAGDPVQALVLTASSSDPTLIPNPTVTYSSPGSTATLSHAAIPGREGTATITVTLVDDGGSANGGIDTTSRQFTQAVFTPADALFANGFE